MVRKSDKQIVIYFFLSVIIFSFFTTETTYLAQNIIVPYISMSPLLIHLGITIITLILLLVLKKGNGIIIDVIFLFLVTRVVSSLIPVTYIIAAQETMGRVTVPIISALAYLIGRQYKDKIDTIVKINMILVTILSVQTIYIVKNMVVPNIIYYKQYIKIPLASSNLIAAFITPCIFLTLTGYQGKWYIKYSVIIISFIALVATRSTAPVLISATMMIFYIIFLNDKINIEVKVLSTFAIIIFAIIVLFYLLSNVYSLSGLTHSRSDLIIYDLSLWTKHVFFGNGMVYEGRGSGTHNILIDLLVQNGLFGFILYAVPLVKVFKRLFINKDKKFLCFKMYLIAAFLHSLVETSYFNYSNDMLFWFMAGVAISQIHYQTENFCFDKKDTLDYRTLIPIPQKQL